MNDDDKQDPRWMLRDTNNVEIPVPGKEIHLAELPFRLTLDERLAGAAGGPPAWSLRLKSIEEWDRMIEDTLTAEARELNAQDLSAREHTRVWEAKLDGIDLGRINDLIDQHNRYYPIEANLPSDPITRLFMRGTEPFRPLEHKSREWIRARFPVAWARAVG